MTDRAFFDTNLLIAFVFHVNSLHNNSEVAFNNYSSVHWSEFVKKEYEKRYIEKLDNLLNFFQKLQVELENPTNEFYSFGDLIDFAKRLSGKSKDDVISSLLPFWNYYFGIESQISFNYLKSNISNCLKDLSINTQLNGSYLEKFMQLTPKRTRRYSNIDRMLKYLGVKDADRTVTLDGHDFACSSSEAVDFVTFDDACFNGARNVGKLCFSSVKGKYDFNAF